VWRCDLGREGSQVLQRGGSLDHRERAEKQRERESSAQGTAQEKHYPKPCDWENKKG